MVNVAGIEPARHGFGGQPAALAVTNMVRVVRVELTISSAQARRLTIKPLPIWSPVKESNLFLSASKAKV